jgi:hypothetical protein
VSNLLYLGIAVVLSAVGILILYLRNRRPSSVEYSVEEFQKELRALSPTERERRDRGGR